jgi:hypothetical protein
MFPQSWQQASSQPPSSKPSDVWWCQCRGGAGQPRSVLQQRTPWLCTVRRRAGGTIRLITACTPRRSGVGRPALVHRVAQAGAGRSAARWPEPCLKPMPGSHVPPWILVAPTGPWSWPAAPPAVWLGYVGVWGCGSHSQKSLQAASLCATLLLPCGLRLGGVMGAAGQLGTQHSLCSSSKSCWAQPAAAGSLFAVCLWSVMRQGGGCGCCTLCVGVVGWVLGRSAGMHRAPTLSPTVANPAACMVGVVSDMLRHPGLHAGVGLAGCSHGFCLGAVCFSLFRKRLQLACGCWCQQQACLCARPHLDRAADANRLQACFQLHT